MRADPDLTPDALAFANRLRQADPVTSLDPCPDCGGACDAGTLQHRGECPLGTGIDVVTAADRKWFDEHPGADHYFRAPSAWEIAEQRWMGAEVPTRVRVAQVAPGLRVREFVMVHSGRPGARDGPRPPASSPQQGPRQHQQTSRPATGLNPDDSEGMA